MKRIIGGAVVTVAAALLAFYIKADTVTKSLIFSYIMWIALSLYWCKKYKTVSADEREDKINTIFDVIKFIFTVVLPAIATLYTGSFMVYVLFPAIVTLLPDIIMVYVFRVENKFLVTIIEITNGLIPTFYFCVWPIINNIFKTVKRRKLKKE